MLPISEVTVADAGSYTCSAENDVGEKKQELQLDVLYAPHVSLVPSRTTSGTVPGCAASGMRDKGYHNVLTHGRVSKNI